ncbi:MAG TPA: ferrous iron transport protein A [Mariniphaga anaerophila]|uniref:Ferrous iron transport protein A n=1 Tax=Mariniphaga anaerophila TaxID=1484053 RepID=A0A831LSF2_9BACT|nr:ferrous iron transport protein A [Mariniphaga anaerophila]
MDKNLKNILTINNLPIGKKGKIKTINGGYGLIQKLDSLGIREGIEIARISTQWMKGPVTIRYGNSEVAIGHNMAMKIMVEPV